MVNNNTVKCTEKKELWVLSSSRCLMAIYIFAKLHEKKNLKYFSSYTVDTSIWQKSLLTMYEGLYNSESR